MQKNQKERNHHKCKKFAFSVLIMFNMCNMKKYPISIETLHYIAGFALVISGILQIFIAEIEMGLSWGIFGAMYLSMSDIGEDEMSEEKKNHWKHCMRRCFGYTGALLGLCLVIYYFVTIF